MINDIVKRALGSSNIQSILEPPGLCTADQKRPDGLISLPWCPGREGSPSYGMRPLLTPWSSPFSAAAEDEARKTSNYNELINRGYIFAPVAFGVQGGCGPKTSKFIKKLGEKLKETTQDPKSAFYMKQRISIVIHIGNAASVLGTLGESDALGQVFYLLH